MQLRREIDAGSVHDTLGGTVGATLPPAYDDVPSRRKPGHTPMSSTASGGTAAVAGGGDADLESQSVLRPAKFD